MLITYSRTGGVLALITVVVVAVAATVLTVAVAATVLIVAVVSGAVLLLARAVLPRSWRHRTVPPATSWPHETIEATVVNVADSSDAGDLVRMDSDKG